MAIRTFFYKGISIPLLSVNYLHNSVNENIKIKDSLETVDINFIIKELSPLLTLNLMNLQV